VSPWTSELQPERTALAWSRSWFTMLCGSVVVARDAFANGVFVAVVVAAVAGAVWAGLAAVVHLAYRRRSRTLTAGGVHEVMLPAALAASATALLSFGALLVALAEA
jgi:hypothetical protein